MRVLIIAFWVLELVALALYIHASWPERTRRGFYLKLICSTVFLAYGITLAVLIRYGINVSFAGSNTGELSAGANTFLEFTGGGLTDRVVRTHRGTGLRLAQGLLPRLSSAGIRGPDLKDAGISTLADLKTAANGLAFWPSSRRALCVCIRSGDHGYEFASTLVRRLFALPIWSRLIPSSWTSKHAGPVGIYFVVLAAMLALA